VPVSISSFSAESIQEKGLVAIDDVASRTPGFDYYSYNVGLGHFFIRGIGSVNRSGTADPAVGFFVDDVYSARGNTGSAAFFDLERIEVMRGPQGTIYGRNTIGGAISVHTVSRPTAGALHSRWTAPQRIQGQCSQPPNLIECFPASGRAQGRLRWTCPQYVHRELRRGSEHSGSPRLASLRTNRPSSFSRRQ
jgi:outer membrane receptor for ferrienterochelin and colicin